MADRPLARLFWHVVDHLDYHLTLARLRILDALTRPSRRRRPIGGGSEIGSG